MTPHLSDRQILAFKHVMECGSVSGAARRMMTAQPGVTRLLKQLEHDIGFTLFERVRGRLVPTPEARIFHREVARAWIGLDQLRATARRIRDRQVGGLRISAMPLLGMTFLPDMLAEFARRHPAAHMQLSNYRSAQVVDEVITQRCDLGFAIVQGEDERFDAERFALPSVCVMPAGHRLAACARVTPADLDGEALIGFESHDALRMALDRALDASGAAPALRIEVSLALQAVRLVLRGQGVAIVDPINAAAFETPALAQRPFDAELGADFSLLTPREQPLSQLAREFSALFRERYDGACAAMSRDTG